MGTSYPKGGPSTLGLRVRPDAQSGGTHTPAHVSGPEMLAKRRVFRYWDLLEPSYFKRQHIVGFHLPNKHALSLVNTDIYNHVFSGSRFHAIQKHISIHVCIDV